MATKEMNVNNAFKIMTKILGKMKYIGNDFCITQNGIITFKRLGGWESILIINPNLNIGNYFNWMYSTCEKFLGDLKENDIKVKGTEIEDNIDEVRIYKDGNFVSSVPKLLNSIEDNTKISLSYYKYLPVYKSELLDDISGWKDIDPNDIENILDGSTITLKENEEFVFLSRDSFPILKKDTRIQYKFLGDLIGVSGNHTDFGCIGFKESYDDFKVLSIAGYVRI